MSQLAPREGPTCNDTGLLLLGAANAMAGIGSAMIETETEPFIIMLS